MQRLPDMDQRDLENDIPYEEDRFFQCACGDLNCKGDGNNPANFNINGAWYAEECPMGRQLDRIAEGRNVASRYDVNRDDTFNRR